MDEHEALDNTVELRTLVTETKLFAILFYTSRESAEVLHGFGNSLLDNENSVETDNSQWTHAAIETNDNSAKILFSVLDVEVDLVSDLWSFGSFNRLSGEECDDCHKQ
jgi:hypothetical protein